MKQRKSGHRDISPLCLLKQMAALGIDYYYSVYYSVPLLTEGETQARLHPQGLCSLSIPADTSLLC